MKILVKLAICSLLIFSIPNSILAAINKTQFANLENTLQSGIGTELVVPENYPSELSLVAKLTKFYPVLDAINHNQAEVIRMKLSKYLSSLGKGSTINAASLQLVNAAPTTSATSYVIYDPNFKQVLAQKNAHEVRSIASISKLFTAIVALESFPPDQQFVMSTASKTVGSSSNIAVGQTFNLSEAIAYLLNQSANDVANQLMLTHDQMFPGASFINKMNNKAAYIGLYNTSFNNPSGLLPQNKSTAVELAKLIDYMQEDYPELLSLGRQVNILRRGKILTSTNPIRNIEGWMGGKNGYISISGRTLAALFKLPSGNEVVISILNSPSDQSLISDTQTLLNALN